MIDLYDIVNESSLVCESFADPRLYQAWMTLKRYNISWKDLFQWGIRVQWDKIDSSDIEEIETRDTKAFENLLKQIRRCKAGKDERTFVIIGMKNEQIQYLYDAYYHSFGMFSYYRSGSKGYVDWYYKDGRGSNKMAQNVMFEYLKECEYLLKIYIDVKNASPLRNERSNARNGMTPDLTADDHKSVHNYTGKLGVSAGGIDPYRIGHDSYYGYCIREAKKAMERYKELAAEHKFERDQDTSKIDSAVEKILARVPKACMNATKNPEKYSKYDLERLMKMVYDKYVYHSGRSMRDNYTVSYDQLMATYTQYCTTVMDLKTGKAYNSADALEKKKTYEKAILQMVLNIDEKLKEFDA